MCTSEDAGKGSVGVDAVASCVIISHRDDTNKHVLHDHNESRSLTMVYPLNFNKLLHHVDSYVVHTSQDCLLCPINALFPAVQ